MIKELERHNFVILGCLFSANVTIKKVENENQIQKPKFGKLPKELEKKTYLATPKLAPYPSRFLPVASKNFKNVALLSLFSEY